MKQERDERGRQTGANLTSEMTREEVIRKRRGSGSNCRGGGALGERGQRKRN